VLHDITLEVAPGQVTALLGPNGAGKSTLVLAVAGVLRPSGGSVALGDKQLAGRRPEAVRAAGLAAVPEGRKLMGKLTVEDNMKVATFRLSKDEARSGVDYVLELFPRLKERWRSDARLLSGGEQQMLVLAQALVSRPSVLVVDELSLGLAPVVVKRLIPTLASVAESGTGILLIEQFVHIALALANSAYIIEAGRLRYRGTAAELRENPDLMRSAYLLREEPVGVQGVPFGG
jgi:branched-chain amino acid transport system ATP-binding protein